MRGFPVEDIGNGLPLSRRQGGNKHQALDLLAPGRTDHRTGVGVSSQHNRSQGALQGTLHRLHIITL